MHERHRKEPRQRPISAREISPREAFLADFGHAPDDPAHHVSDPITESRRALHGRSACGWWWCRATLGPSRWIDLRKALEVLRDHGIDPNGKDVVDVASRVRAFEQLAPAKHLLNDFHSAATKLMAALWPNGPTEVGPRNWSAVRDGDRWVFVAETRAPELLAEVVARFGPMVELANAARPVDQDRRTKNGPRAAIAKAREIHRAGRNWTVEAVAAAVLLTGVDVDDLDDIVAKYLKADTRKPRIRPRKRR